MMVILAASDTDSSDWSAEKQMSQTVWTHEETLGGSLFLMDNIFVLRSLLRTILRK